MHALWVLVIIPLAVTALTWGGAWCWAHYRQVIR